MTTDTAVTTYTERAGQMSKAARKAAFTQAAKHLERFKNATMNIGELKVVRLNQLREAGLQFNIGCGREQLQFTIEGIEFARREILPLMPKGIDIDQIHGCVLIANKMPEPARTAEEAAALEKMFQSEFEMLGLVASHRRKELQSSHARNLFSEFVNRTAGLNVLVSDLEKDEPMDRWPAQKVEEFLQTAQPFKEKILKAESLLMQRKCT